MEANERAYPTPHGEIHYWIDLAASDAPWLVFLPGLTADHHLFDRQAEHFRGNCNLLLWDAPAHGRSRPFALRFDVRDLARWLHEILAAEGVARPILVGQSMGGYIAQYYMDEYPADVAGFVSIDSSSLKRRYYTGWELALLKHTKWIFLLIPWRLLIHWGVRGTAKSTYGRAHMLQTMQSFERREYCALADHGYRILAEAVEEVRRKYEIPCPALLFCGECDRAGSARCYNRNWEAQEGLKLVWVPGAGHNSNTDAPAFVNARLEAFIASLDPVRARCAH